MLTISDKLDELNEKIKKFRAKFKQETKFYIEVGRVLYKLKRFQEARKLRDSALRTISDKKSRK